MAESNYRVNAARGGLGGLLSGLRTASDSMAKNRFERDNKLEDRRFEIAKMMATDQMVRERQSQQNQFSRETEMMKWNRDQYPGQPMYGQPGQLTPKQLFEQNEKNRKLEEAGKEPSMDEMIAFATGKLPSDKSEGLGEDEVAALIAEIAKNRGYSQSGEKEVSEGGGWFGIGAQKRKIPIYSKNQFQR